jgi:hypothetical protein
MMFPVVETFDVLSSSEVLSMSVFRFDYRLFYGFVNTSSCVNTDELLIRRQVFDCSDLLFSFSSSIVHISSAVHCDTTDTGIHSRTMTRGYVSNFSLSFATIGPL